MDAPLKFPDGTPQNVIDRAVKDFALAHGPTAAQKWGQKVASSSTPVDNELFQGLTFGYGDEMDAGVSALAVGLHNLTSNPKFTMGEAYDAELSAERKRDADYESAHPVASTALQIAGGAANPISEAGAGFIKGSASLLGRIGRGALVGAPVGAAAGFGAGQGGFHDRMISAVYGGVPGAAIGGSTPVMADFTKNIGAPAAKELGKTLNNYFRRAYQKVSGMSPEQAQKALSPQDQQKMADMALQYVRDLVKSSGTTAQKLTDDPAHKLGIPVTTAESIGRRGEVEMQKNIRRSGMAAQNATPMFRQRMEETPSAVEADLGKVTGVDPSTIQGNFEKTIQTMKERNPALYKRALDIPAPDLETQPELKALLMRPSVKLAISKARDIAAEEGLNPDEVVKVAGVRNKVYGLDASGNHALVDAPKDMDPNDRRVIKDPTEITLVNPTMRTWDYVKRGLGDVIYDKYKNPVTGKLDLSRVGSSQEKKTLDALRDNLFRMSPDYKTAVETAGEPIRMQEAYEDAPKLLSSNVSVSDFHKRIDRMSPSDVEALKGGLINAVKERADSGKPMKAFLTSPGFKEKARTLLGTSQANAFIDHVNQRLRLKESASRMLNGSPTMELTTAAEQEDKNANDMFSFAHRGVRRGFVHAGMELALDKAKRAHATMTTPYHEELRNQISRLLMQSPDKTRSVLEQLGPQSSAKNVSNRLGLTAGVVPFSDEAGQTTGAP